MLLPEDRALLEDVFQGIQLAPETVDDIMSMLSQGAASMSNSTLTEVRDGAFGDSLTGSFRLGTNAAMAHQALVDEMTNLVAGLRGYRDAIRAWADDLTAVDSDSRGYISSVETAAQCVATPTIDAGACTLPTEDQP